MRENGDAICPVVDGIVLVGVIGPAQIAKLVGNGADLTDACSTAMVPAEPIESWHPAAEALRRFDLNPHEPLLVVDGHRRLLGVVTPADLVPRIRPQPRPPAVGGMATPFGVYLTTGAVSAGPNKWALVATGALMFGLIAAGNGLAYLTGNALEPQRLPSTVLEAIVAFITFGVFLLGLRLLPLSGTHGAEHQVVHAIERGEELAPNVVARMPRVHPRCGTNFAAAAILFLSIFESPLPIGSDVRFLMAALATFFLWRPLGSALQRWITTKRPNAKQLEGGIRSGKQLLERYVVAENTMPTIQSRIWNSGMLQVMFGSLLMYGIIVGIAALLGYSIAL